MLNIFKTIYTSFTRLPMPAALEALNIIESEPERVKNLRI